MKNVSSIAILVLVKLCVRVRSHDLALVSKSSFNYHPFNIPGNNSSDVCFNNRSISYLKARYYGVPFTIKEDILQQDRPCLHHVLKNHLISHYVTSPPKRRREVFQQLQPNYFQPRNLPTRRNFQRQENNENLLRNSPFAEKGKRITEIAQPIRENRVSTNPTDDFVTASSDMIYNGETRTDKRISNYSNSLRQYNASLFKKFTKSLERFERKFYQTTFNKLISISPESRLENGISFAISSIFLYLALIALSMEVDSATSLEIDTSLGLQVSVVDKIAILAQVSSWLPVSNHNFKFRWASRVVLESGLTVSQQFMEKVAPALHLNVERLNGTETSEVLVGALNEMIMTDSGGAMRNTFEEEDFTTRACSILLNTMYIRARWRSPPTVLNGSRPFRDTDKTPQRSVRMIRINDIMRYALLKEWRAEALEISYAIPDLKLLLLVPQGHSIKDLSTNMAKVKLSKIYERMGTARIAAILPIYTLRMTLLLPGKLQMVGISRLMNATIGANGRCGQLRLSHGVQRLMFWAEAGRSAFKDDGIEWDDTPEKEVLVDRPYLFYVRWKNITLMNGNFVL